MALWCIGGVYGVSLWCGRCEYVVFEGGVYVYGVFLSCFCMYGVCGGYSVCTLVVLPLCVFMWCVWVYDTMVCVLCVYKCDGTCYNVYVMIVNCVCIHYWCTMVVCMYGRCNT